MRLSFREYVGPGSVQRLAKRLQPMFKVTYAAAVTKARIALGLD